MPVPALPALSVSKGLPRRVDVLVLGLAESGLRGLPDAVGQAYRQRFGTGVAEMARSLGAQTKLDSRRTLPSAGDGPRLMVVGLGDGEPDIEGLRRVAGSAVRHAATLAEDGQSVAVSVDLGTTTVEELEAVSEGALLGSYRYAPVSSAPATAPAAVDSITVLHPGSTRSASGAEVTAVASTVAAAVLTAREWVNTHPTCSTPSPSPTR